MANSVTQTTTTATQSSQDVGLIFVREYYTFLNKKPSRLHAFYSKDSLFVRGDEGAITETAKGQEEICKKIEECKFEDCKVLVTQVDSQLSVNDGILIHVLGEMCNQNGPSQKFSQTFFLATQPNGYYVLNDIFRFLKDEVQIDYYSYEEGEAKKTSTTQPVSADATTTIKTPEIIKNEQMPVNVEEKKEKVEEPVKEEKVTKKEPAKEKEKKEEKNIEKTKKPETPAELAEASSPILTSPIPSKVSTPAKEIIEPVVEEKKKTKSDLKQSNKQKQEPEKSSNKPAMPKTWAHLTAAAATASNISTATNVPAAEESTVTPATVAPTATSPVINNAEKPIQHQAHHQQQHHHKNQAPRSKDSITQIFVKQVYESVNEEQLKEAFTKIGAVKHINISRPKNCAFVEFTSPESVQKALAQHKVPLSSGSIVLAEERRFSSNQSGNRYNQGRNQNYSNVSSNFERRPNSHRRQGQNARNSATGTNKSKNTPNGNQK
ncbi:hypothetical protein G6F37_008839 [Rhizopus arrhizus]|nr:hypothetical protein G6F38_001443 [Rhizopus arrhizus]KAG1155109.1 hypothetical protein G6F37_008839 [Rhizopus arrhizus]